MNSNMPSPTLNPPQGIQMPPGVPQAPSNSPQLGIAQKITQGMAPAKPAVIPESQGVNILVGAIKGLNQYADLIATSDEANSRAVRSIIRILGEILKSAEHEQPQLTENQGM